MSCAAVVNDRLDVVEIGVLSTERAQRIVRHQCETMRCTMRCPHHGVLPLIVYSTCETIALIVGFSSSLFVGT